MPPLASVEKGGVLVITFDDLATLNEAHATSLRQGLYSTLSSRERPLVAIDLSPIDYLSSSGIALLIGTKRRVEAAAGQLVLFGIQPEVRDLFNVMKLTTLFEIVGDEAQALQLLSPRPPL